MFVLFDLFFLIFLFTTNPSLFLVLITVKREISASGLFISINIDVDDFDQVYQMLT